MADEREHVRVITTSDIIQNKREIARSRVGAASYHNTKKDARKGSYHGYGSHKELKRKGESRENLSEKRKVIDRNFVNESAETRVRSRVEVVKGPKDEKPLLITVRNDMKDSGKRGYHSNHITDEKEFNRKWKTRYDEVIVRRIDSEQEQQIVTSQGESSDVDSDYTIEMRSHQGSDENDSDGDDDDSVYSVEFKNIGGSDEEDEDDKDGQSEGANEDELVDRISEQYVLKEKGLQKVTAEVAEDNEIDGSENEVVSSEDSGNEEQEQERTVIVRKSRNNDVSVRENRTPEIEKKSQDASSEDNAEVSLIVYSNKGDFDRMQEFSEKKPIDKFAAAKEMKHDSEGVIRDDVDNKAKSSRQRTKVRLVNEERKDIKDIVKDTVHSDIIVYGKDKSKSIVGDAPTKTKMSNEKKLREEINILEEKLGKEQTKKTPTKVGDAAHVEKRGHQKIDVLKDETPKSEKQTGRGTASRNAGGKAINSEKRIENVEVINSRSSSAKKPKEGSADNKSAKTSCKNLTDLSVAGKSSSAKKTVDAVVKEQSEIGKDASKDTTKNIPKAEKKSAQVIKDSNDKITVDRKQVKSAPEEKRKSRFNDVKRGNPTIKRKQDNFNETKRLENSKKSKKFKGHGRDRSSSESSSSTDSKTESSNSSSDQSDSESTSESETESDNSDSESVKSNSSRSSDSSSSSDSSQSSDSSSESSSSEEDNFKRRRRPSSDSKPVNINDKKRNSSPRKEKEPRYISPLRTKRSEWGTRRHEDNHPYKRTDEKYRKLPERREDNQSYNRSHRFSKDRQRERSRTRSRSRDRGRGSTNRRPRSRDRTDTRARMDSRERRYSRNNMYFQDRARGSRHVSDYKRDSNNLRNQKGAIDDRKEAVERRRTDDRGRGQRSSREASKNESQDKLDGQSQKKDVEKSYKKNDSNDPKTKSPGKETVIKDADKSKSIASKEKSLNLKESGSYENRNLDIVKVESSSETSTGNTLITKESQKPKPLMELNIKVDDTEEDVTKPLLQTAAEPRSNTLSIKTVSTDKSQQLKHEVNDEPKPLMEITLSTITRPTAEPEGRQRRRVSMAGPSGLRATKESKSPRGSVERRQVKRIDQPNTIDGELFNQKRSENRDEAARDRPEERQIVNSRVYLKRLSCGKEVYFENRKIEPLMKPIDFDGEVIKKPRIVESLSDENENQRSIRRVISDSGSDIPQIQITSDGLQPQSKRKVFSRLGRSITKPKNISINLKTNPVREDSKGVPTVKNENEVELDERIKSIREKNEEILRRQKEIEEDIKLNS